MIVVVVDGEINASAHVTSRIASPEQLSEESYWSVGGMQYLAYGRHSWSTVPRFVL